MSYEYVVVFTAVVNTIVNILRELRERKRYKNKRE